MKNNEVHNILILDGYPGAAVLVRPDCTVIASNAKGAGLEALLAHKAAPEILAVIEQAAERDQIAVGVISLPAPKGQVILEVTVVPQPGGVSLLVLAKDLTMERNLRSTLIESRQRYKDLVEISSDFSWEIGSNGEYSFVSPRGALGYPAERIVGRKPEEFVINPEEYSPLPFISEQRVENVEIWMRRADGSTACIVVSCMPLKTESGEWRGARGVCRDVTEEREREAALTQARHREQLLNYIVSTIRDEVEPTNMLTTAAAATARALGAAGCGIYRLGEAGAFIMAADYGNCEGVDDLNQHLNGLKGDTEIIENKIGKWLMLAAATHYRQSVNGAITMWKTAKNGAWDNDSRILISDVANQLGIANEQISNHERILKLSRTDGLTGLLNRRAFYEEELPRRIERLKRNRQTAALFYVDLDSFKRVNDVKGHQAGDAVLLYLRDLLLDFSRPGDVISRLGGDEFAMWLDGIGEEVVLNRVETLLKSSKKLLQFSGDDAHPLGISVGIAMYDPESDENLESLLARADEAMYAVKRDGKGSFRMAPFSGACSESADSNSSKKKEPS
ncbi:MAG: hypothetical protein A3G18_05420 [Rhodospirillales bacterium RIFCSPLOWO2_12_FULL_58_28]|nr:MAG: hypothetical protein A3H92_05715 [Rhodospirillales bacterium RIFCSPLOWO2_02_FULL_58_16]OHC79395.1 MAG: hypothetical protein A3G18_05420 [Rhodospirillales bacterium RIFCSPLOWO2_12_FULL_58_28]